ncbi:HD domain-containing phosphohydrolase [Deinococcus sp. YIM 134068]|uniref:bifunctional diguanylate cyclase/phosphohydrolase n=1 Tax=Deinococcus lichenicola TaxID=3118910 RepID=UPI002F933F4C
MTSRLPTSRVWTTVRSFLALLARDDEASEPDWQALLEAAVASVPGAQAGSLNVREGEAFVMRAVVGFDRGLLGTSHPEAALRRWYGQDEVWREAGQPRVLRGEDLREHSRRAHEGSGLRGHDELFETLGERGSLCANICLPVVVGGVVVAELNLDNLSDEAALTPDSVGVAQEFGMLAAAALAARERRGREAARVLELAAAREGTLLALGVALETRDLETSGHTERVVRLARALGRALGLSGGELEALTQGAYLHDLGKLAISDTILRKPGKLTPEEFTLMKTHATHGHEIAQRLPNLAPGALDVVLHHHEKWNGGGYPFGLSGADIPLLARIFAVCDVYDALTSERPYKRAWTHGAAVAEIVASAGGHFDPRVVRAFAALDVVACLHGGASADPEGNMCAGLTSLDEQARQLQEALHYAEAVIEVTRFAASDLGQDDLCREVLRVVASTSPLDWGGLTLIEGDVARIRPLWPLPVAGTGEEPETVIPRGPGAVWEAMGRTEPLFVEGRGLEGGGHLDALPNALRRGARAVAWLPLLVEPSRAVVLTVVRRAPAEGWTAHDRRLLEAAARSVRATLERHAHVRALEEAAYQDMLTGLGNRRAFEQALEDALARGERVGVMLLDVDGLKAVNDGFGHERGDELLRAFARALRWSVRREDELYRLGGDEFILVFRALAGDGPGEAPLHVRLATAVEGVRAEGFPNVNVSAGFAHSPADGHTVSQLTRVADERMYRVKRARARDGAAHTSPDARHRTDWRG